jgi:hypothetical protein
VPARVDATVLDSRGAERGSPVAQIEGLELEVVPVVTGEDEPGVDAPRMLVERLQHLRPERHTATLPV